jgi:hypothetical protein
VSNPFRTALEAGDSVAAPTAPASVETVSTEPTPLETALAALPDDVDEVHPLEDEDVEALAQAETLEKDGKKREVVSKQTFEKRVRKLVSQRKTAVGERDTARAEVANVKAQIQQIKPIIGVAQRYKGREAQLEWDVDFVDAAEELAKNDPEVQSVAARILDRMKKGKTVQTDVNRDTVAAPTAQTPASTPDPKQNELLVVTERVVNRDARRMLTETLEKAGVDERYVKIIANSAMKDLSVAQRAELDSDKVLAFTKKYLKANELTASDVLKSATPAEKNAKPNTAPSQGKPAPSTKTNEKPAATKGEPKFKNYEEYKEHRRAGIRQFASELGMDS